MSHQATEAVFRYSRAPFAARSVLLYLAVRANKHRDHIAWPAVERIASDMNLSKRQVKRHLRSLESLGELLISNQTGRSQQNEFALLLPELPPTHLLARKRENLSGRGGDTNDTPSPPFRGDVQGAKGVTPEVKRGVISDTQTEETESSNITPPSNPPAGDDALFEFWLGIVAKHFRIKPSDVSARDRACLAKVTLPSREHAEAMHRYLKAEPPARCDRSEQAQLLGRRKQKPSTIIRHLAEMVSDALRFDELQRRDRHGAAVRRPTYIPEPEGDWRTLGLRDYLFDDTPAYQRHNELVREKFSPDSKWSDLDRGMQKDISGKMKQPEAVRPAA